MLDRRAPPNLCPLLAPQNPRGAATMRTSMAIAVATAALLVVLPACMTTVEARELHAIFPFQTNGGKCDVTKTPSGSVRMWQCKPCTHT